MNIRISVRMSLAKQNNDLKWLADKLGVSYTRTCRIARSKNLNISTIARMAEIFDMKTSEFIALGEEES
jgi:DNA-binding Xre family transcriptional regulator